jgi:hypothetical protein
VGPYDQGLFCVGGLGRAGDDDAKAVGAPLNLLVSLVEIVHDLAGWDDQDQDQHEASAYMDRKFLILLLASRGPKPTPTPGCSKNRHFTMLTVCVTEGWRDAGVCLQQGRLFFERLASLVSK